MNKVVYVPAHKAPMFKRVVRKESTGDTKTGIFGREIKLTRGVSEKVLSGYSDSKIDGQRLSKDIQKAVDNLNKKGYEVICISEVTSGSYAWDGHKHYGYSYTEGVNIIAKKVV
jgi:pantoate kinase